MEIYYNNGERWAGLIKRNVENLNKMFGYVPNLLLRELLQAEARLPHELFHYAGPEATLAILKSSAIRMTPTNYLNDTAEVHTCADLVRKVLDDRQVAGSVRAEFEASLATPLVAGELVVASFSEEGNSLSQFRAYCPEKGGFAVGVNLDRLSPPVPHLLIKCVYDSVRQHQLIWAGVDWAINNAAIRSARPAPSDDVRSAAMNNRVIEGLRAMVYLWAAAFKHVAFKDEVEWRLVARRPEASRLEFNVRKSGMIAPYFSVELGHVEPSPISSVVIGPTPFPELAASSIRILGEQHERRMNVELSRIPYRAW